MHALQVRCTPAPHYIHVTHNRFTTFREIPIAMLLLYLLNESVYGDVNFRKDRRNTREDLVDVNETFFFLDVQ